jgi:hypothetical protein
MRLARSIRLLDSRFEARLFSRPEGRKNVSEYRRAEPLVVVFVLGLKRSNRPVALACIAHKFLENL